MPVISHDMLSTRLRAIADPQRRAILRLLSMRGQCSIGKEMGMCASDVESRLNLSQPTISHHMRVLAESGLIRGEKIGLWMWYRRNEANIKALLREVREI
jgi:ArsR family transcriptional regulator